MTTRFPFCTVIMELAAQAEMRGVRMEAEWTPRDRNQEADDLSNLLTSSFDPDKEVKLNLTGQSWLVLPALLEAGQKFHDRKTQEAGGATRRQGEEEERGQTEKQGEVVKTGESWKARQQQQYSQKSPVDVRREARTAPVFGDLVTYSKGDGGVLGVFDSGVAPDFHVELVRFSRSFLSQFSVCVAEGLSQFSITVFGLWCPVFRCRFSVPFLGCLLFQFSSARHFSGQTIFFISAVQTAPIFE